MDRGLSAIALAACLLGAACSGATLGADAGGDSGTTGGPSWEALESWLHSQVVSGKIHGYAAQVFDANDALVFASQDGVCGDSRPCGGSAKTYTADLVTGVASSSKWVTSTVILSALEQAVAGGRFTNLSQALDGLHVSDVLSCVGAGRGASVTMRQLLSFTDGLLPDHACVGKPGETLQSCACKILKDSAAAEVPSAMSGSPSKNAQPPGTVFKYGAAHHVVAGAMVEVLAGKAWTDLYTTLVKTPVGLDATYRDATDLAGSLHASVADYVKFVKAIFHDGKLPTGQPPTILSAAAVAEQQRSQMPAGVIYLTTPQPGFEYGCNNWRWCAKPYSVADLEATTLSIDSTCSAEHQTGHGGKGGYQPWIDLSHDFYGVFAMREPSAGGGASYSSTEIGITRYVRMYSALVFRAQHP